MKQHKVVGFKNALVQTVRVFYSTARCLGTGYKFVRASIQIHAAPICTGHYPHSYPTFAFQINSSASKKEGHSIEILCSSRQ